MQEFWMTWPWQDVHLAGFHQVKTVCHLGKTRLLLLHHVILCATLAKHSAINMVQLLQYCICWCIVCLGMVLRDLSSKSGPWGQLQPYLDQCSCSSICPFYPLCGVWAVSTPTSWAVCTDSRLQCSCSNSLFLCSTGQVHVIPVLILSYQGRGTSSKCLPLVKPSPGLGTWLILSPVLDPGLIPGSVLWYRTNPCSSPHHHAAPY